MTTGIQINGVDLANIYSAASGTDASATGIKTNGTDLSSLLLNIANGSALGRNVGLEKNGSDLSSIFGVEGVLADPGYETPLYST
jgi:hypothetical protein